MAAMTSKPLVISDLLCFAVNKFHRVPNKVLKNVLLDFYTSDDVSTAKEILVNEVDKVLSDKWPKPVRRRKDSLNRSTSEIDDILSVVSTLDNNKTIDLLPLFVSSDPDKMPSIKLTDGDLAVVMMKLSKIEARIDENKELIRLDISDLKTVKAKTVICEECVRMPPSSGRIVEPTNNSAVGGRALAVDRLRCSGATNLTSEGTETDDNDGFTTQHRKKRKKQGPSPSANHATPSGSYAAVASQRLPSGLPKPSAAKPLSSKPIFIGTSSTSAIRAAKTLIVKKAIFRLGNIDSDYTENDIAEYIRSLGVNLLSCFELKHSLRQPLDNKAFRVCILAADKIKLCDLNNWSVGVSLREWVHKPKVGPSSDDTSRVGTGGHTEMEATLGGTTSDNYLSVDDVADPGIVIN